MGDWKGARPASVEPAHGGRFGMVDLGHEGKPGSGKDSTCAMKPEESKRASKEWRQSHASSVRELTATVSRN